MKNNNVRAVFAVVLGALLSGATSSFTKIGLFDIPVLSFAFVRFLIASLVITPILLYRKEFKIKNFFDLAPFSFLAVVNIIFFTFGVKYTTATISQLLYAGVPLFVGIISYVIYKEKVSFMRISGILIGFIGVFIIVLLPIIQYNEQFSGNLFGNMLIGIATIFWAFFMVFSKRKQKLYSPLVITASFIYTSFVVLLPFSFYESISFFGWWSNLTFNSWISLLYVSIMTTIVGYFLNQIAVKYGGSLIASMNLYLLPVFSFIFASILLKEQLTYGLIVGGVFSLIGVFLVSFKR